MADVLVKAGHQVTFFIPETSTFNKLNGTKLAKVVRMPNLGRFFDDVMMSHGDPFEAQSPSFFDHRMEVISQYRVCEEILKRKEELEMLNAENFDLAIADNVDFCDISLIHMLGIPVHIWTTTGPMHEITAWALGVPPEPAYVPTTWDNFLSPIMGLGERAYNLLQHYIGRIHALELDIQVTRLFRKYVRGDFPSAAELAANSAIMFMNGDQFFDPVRPLPSKCINIGGVGLIKPRELSTEFKDMAEQGKKGFIIFALGTAAPTRAVASWRKKALVDAFSTFTDYHFIVKMDAEDYDFLNMTRQVGNIDAVNWIPQSDLLAHPRAKLFITHGGYNSIIESGIRGVPMLVLPLFFDQHRNAKAIEYRKLGLALEPSTITKSNLIAKLNELLTNPVYQQNAYRSAKLFRTKPDQPDQTLVKWVEFVLENGNLPELKPELANMNFIVYNNLDVFAVVLLMVSFCSYTFVTVCKKFLQFGRNRYLTKLKRA
ncbi:unnamed protein product [Bursaphelenchus okinawaensis]|uniref:glucuronosyltransferase n=1 Tax=Bursaphelenchus okinawaensis TaxID=465554 RepID=A0A811L193_9BILA|nr:unnamed protein product [Bursaphelenchus okinawaensis]CAG9115693.1 unnamed protein product [Bursaphelenchus okinawaensis]